MKRYKDANEIIHRFELFTGIHQENLAGIEAQNMEEQIDSLSEALCECHAKLENVSQWISVKDQRPEEGVPVFAGNNKSVSMFAVMYDHGWLWGEVYGYWREDGKWACEYEVNDDYDWITHWMPLPEPPESTGGSDV